MAASAEARFSNTDDIQCGSIIGYEVENTPNDHQGLENVESNMENNDQTNQLSACNIMTLERDVIISQGTSIRGQREDLNVNPIDNDVQQTLSVDCSVVGSSTALEFQRGEILLDHPSNSALQRDYALHYLSRKIKDTLNIGFGKSRIGICYEYKPPHKKIIHRQYAYSKTNIEIQQMLDEMDFVSINEFGTFIE